MNPWTIALSAVAVVGALVHVFAAQPVVNRPLFGIKFLTLQRVAGVLTLILVVPILLAALG